MDRRTLNWPAIITSTVLLAAVVILASRPNLLAPLVTHLLNRQLLSKVDGELVVQRYQLRPFAGLDLFDVSVKLRPDQGGHTLVHADSVGVDFRVRELLGARPHLRRVQLTGVQVFHNQATPTAEKATGAFSPPRVTIDLFWLQDAEVQISGADGRLREYVKEVSLRGRVGGDRDSLRLRSHLARADWTTRDAVLSRLRGDVVLGSGGLRVETLSGHLNDNGINVSGTVDFGGDIDIEVAADHTSAYEVAVLTGAELDFAAEGGIDAAIRTDGDTVYLDARRFDGVIEGFDLHDVSGKAVIGSGEVRFDRVRGEVAGANYDGNLIIVTDAPGGADVRLDGYAERVDLSAGVIPEAEDLPPTWGHGRLRIRHTGADGWTKVSGLLADGEIAIMPFDTCRFDVSAREDSLIFHSLDLIHRSIGAQFVGTSDRLEIVSGSLSLTAGDLRDLPASWEMPPQLRGGVQGRLAVSGPLEDLAVSGDAEVRDLSLGALTVSGGEAAVSAARVLGEDWQLDLDLNGRQLGLGGVPLGDFVVGGSVSPAAVRVDTFRAQRGDTVVTFLGTAALRDGEADLDLQRLRIGIAGSDWYTPVPLTARVGGRRVVVPEIQLLSDHGHLSGRLRLEEGPIDGDLHLDRFDLRLLEPFVAASRGIGGTVTADARLSGTSAEPEFTLVGRLLAAAFPLARVDTLVVDGRYRGGVVRLEELEIASEFGHVSVAGTVSPSGRTVAEFWPGAGLDLEVGITGGNWAFLEPFAIPALERLAGKVDGTLHVTGSTDAPQITGRLDSAPFQIHWLKLERLTGEIRADPKLLTLGNLAGHHGDLQLRGRLELPLQFDFLSEPVTPEDGPFYARFVVPEETDLSPLVHATGAFIRASGRGSGEVVISGPLSHPLWQGEVQIDDAGFVITQTQEVFHEVSARGRFAGDDLIIEELQGNEGLTGSFDGTGYVRFKGLELENYEIDLEVDEFLLATVPDLQALLQSSNARITGVTVGPDSVLVPKLTGDFDLILGRYTGNFAGEAGGNDPTLGTVAPDWLAEVHVTGGTRTARIVNQNLDIDMSGDVTLVRDESGLFLRGGMDIDAGRLPVFVNTFNVVRGHLDFSQEVGLVPRVDLTAETRIRLRSPRVGASTVERITVHVTGSVASPTITYSSESGYPREAVERMLLGLSPYPDEQGDNSALANSSWGAGLNLVERELAQGINFVDTVELEQVSGQQPGDNQFSPLVGVGKYVRILGGEVYIKGAVGVTNTENLDVLVEYWLRNDILLQYELRRRFDEYQGAETHNVDVIYRIEY